MEVKISAKPNISSNALFTNTAASSQFNYVNKSGDINQTCLNIPQMPNPLLSSFVSPSINSATQYNNNNNNNNNNRASYLPPVVNNNVNRMTITPPGVSSSTINQNSFRQTSQLPNIQQVNNNTGNFMGQSYQPPVSFNNSYLSPQPPQPPLNQSYQQPQQPLNQSYQQPQQPLNQSYQQPPAYNNNINMNDSIPMPFEHSYFNPHPSDISAYDIPQPPAHDYSFKPDGDFTLTDQIVKNEYHTYVLYEPPLGSGSYATAYLVSCESYTLVMKKMNIKKYQDNVLKMLQDEMKILSALDEHPNVIQYMDGFKQGDYYYLVMNYCRDGDLLEVIHKHKEDNKPIPEDDIIKYITDIAKGILFIHKNNIVHRDLKPGNIFLDRGRCVIGDFGISKMINDDSVSCSTFIGTPSYMAPEMFKEEKYDGSVDIWAFGCIIIELCTLNLPFSGSNLVAIMKEIESANIPELNGYSSFLVSLVHKCVVYDPQSRLTAEQVVNYLSSSH